MDHKTEATKIYNRLQALVSDSREDRKPSKKQLDDLKAIERQLDMWMYMAVNQVTLEEAEMAI